MEVSGMGRRMIQHCAINKPRFLRSLAKKSQFNSQASSITIGSVCNMAIKGY